MQADLPSIQTSLTHLRVAIERTAGERNSSKISGLNFITSAIEAISNNYKEISLLCQISCPKLEAYLEGFKIYSDLSLSEFKPLTAIIKINNICTELEVNNSLEQYSDLAIFQQLLSESKFYDGENNLLIKSDIQLIKELVREQRHQAHEEKLSKLDLLIDDTKKSIEGVREDISNIGNAINDTKSDIIKISSDAGFVELNYGFDSLRKAKSKELLFKTITKWCFVLLMFIAVAGELCVILTLDPDKNAIAHSLIGLPIFTALLLLIYFFRLTYREEDAVKSQILQIDLRMSLIRFFKSYSDHANEIRPQDKRGSELEKFESIIFSNIAPNQEKMPGAFDGVDDLIKLLKASK